VGPRWRDLEWVDFSPSVSAVDDLPVPAPASPEPLPAPDSEPTAGAIAPTSLEPALAAAPPDIAKALRYFATPAEDVLGAKREPIPGLSERFARVAVPRSLEVQAPPPPSLPLAPPWITRLSGVPRTSRPGDADLPISTAIREPPPLAVAVPAAPRAPRRAKPRSEPPLASPPGRIVPGVRDDVPFPASFYISTSTAPAAAEPARRKGHAFAAQLGRIRETMRDRSGITALALTDGLGRAKSAMKRGVPARRAATTIAAKPAPVGTGPVVQPGIAAPAAPPLPRRALLLVTRYADAINDWARRTAGGDGGLRLSALITLAVLLVAVLASGGAALIAGLVHGGSKQLVAADQHPQTVQAPVAVPAPPAAPEPASNVPPSDPATRAAFYLARAKAGDATAQYDLGVLYATGDGLVQDYASAVSWFHAAAAQGNVDAEYNLGVLNERGLGVPVDDTEALNWYRSAADQNHAGAQFNLAVAYAEGRGVGQDFTAAARWYLRAAQQGLSPAMVNLAILYERGDGVDRSPVDAYAWYSAAGERGAADAKDRADQLFQQFNDKDKARAEGLAATLGAALDSATPPA
jgi:hypothetical protein